MKPHNELKDIFPLAAVAALVEHEAAIVVTQHMRVRTTCTKEFERREVIAQTSVALPARRVPDGLIQNALVHVIRMRKAADDCRRTICVLSALVARSWISSLLTCLLFSFRATAIFLPMLAIFNLLTWTTAACDGLSLRTSS